MQIPPKSPATRHYIVRIMHKDHNQVYGQVSEPATGWKQTFQSLDELTRLLEAQQHECAIGTEPHSNAC